jgi:hypothetical protein
MRARLLDPTGTRVRVRRSHQELDGSIALAQPEAVLGECLREIAPRERLVAPAHRAFLES